MNNKPIVISFVSGKGGVGKTMLAVAAARELSLNCRVLLIDLDFFNRGLTGLLGEGKEQCAEIGTPDFLSSSSAEGSTTWRIVEVTENLYHINYPDLSPADMQAFETADVDVLVASLARFVQQACLQCECECVVLDCHGGPDNSSFAACRISDYSLLVSEPDRITFYGTLNFLRQLKRASTSQEIDLRLVFNKVVPAFSALFLTNFYERAIKLEFAGRPLMGVFPLEVYLTKEFERTPFLTAVYPYSALAKKTRLLLHDLLNERFPRLLAPAIRSLPLWTRAYYRLTLSKQFPLLNLNVVLPTIVTVIISVILLNLALSNIFFREKEKIHKSITRIAMLQCVRDSPSLLEVPQRFRAIVDNGDDNPYNWEYVFRADPVPPDFHRFRDCVELSSSPNERDYRRAHQLLRRKAATLDNLKPNAVPGEYRDLFDREVAELRNPLKVFVLLETASETIEPYTQFFVALGIIWIAMAMLVGWTSALNRSFTYYSRLHRYPIMCGLGLVVLALWFAPLIMVAVALDSSIETLARSTFKASDHVPAIVMLALGGSAFLGILFTEIVRVYRDARYEHHYFEDLLRVVFLAYLLGMPIIWYQGFVK